jgi:hypothetical protein
MGCLPILATLNRHEAERAVRAALSLVEAVPKVATDACSPLQMRVGIATGLAVVGDVIGADGGRRDPEPCHSAPGAGGARRHRDCIKHTAPALPRTGSRRYA